MQTTAACRLLLLNPRTAGPWGARQGNVATTVRMHVLNFHSVQNQCLMYQSRHRRQAAHKSTRLQRQSLAALFAPAGSLPTQ